MTQMMTQSNGYSSVCASYGLSQSSESYGLGQRSLTFDLSARKNTQLVNLHPETVFMLSSTVNTCPTDNDERFANCILTRTVRKMQCDLGFSSLLHNVAFTDMLCIASCISINEQSLENPFDTDITVSSSFQLKRQRSCVRLYTLSLI